MGEFERIITISKNSVMNENIFILNEEIQLKATVSMQVNKDTRIRLNDEIIELKKTKIFKIKDIVSNIEVYPLEDDVRFYVTIRYKENVGQLFTIKEE